MSILVLGTVALDTVKTPVGKKTRMLGGSACHFAMSARLFTPVHLVGVIGYDFPNQYIRFLESKKIILSSLDQDPGVKTFHWAGEYRGDMNAALTLKTELGVLAIFKPHVANYERNIKHVFLANVDPDIQKALLAQMHTPKLIGLDSMNFWIQHKRPALMRMLKKVDIFVANDGETRQLTGISNLLKAAKKMRSYGPKIIVVKKGEHGVLVYSDRFRFSLPGYPVDTVVDPTGAGDTFAGALMGYLSRSNKMTEQALRTAIAYATVAGSINVEGFGVSRTSRLTKEVLEQRMKQFRQLIRF